MSQLIESALKEQGDSILIAASKRGENRAFDVLVERYNARIFGVVLRMIRNREYAEDVGQQSSRTPLSICKVSKGNHHFLRG